MMRTRSSMAGFMMLEALVAIFIFSLAILGVIGFQATATRLTTDSAFRTEAALYADELAARMAVSNQANLVAQYSSPSGPAFVAWKNTRLSNLPSSDATVTITQDPSNSTDTFVALITITWLPPGVDGSDATVVATYRYNTSTLIEF